MHGRRGGKIAVWGKPKSMGRGPRKVDANLKGVKEILQKD